MAARRININLATEEKLEALPLIGPKRAARIVEYRRRHGWFRSLRELELVPGIGEKIAARLKGRVTL